MDKDTLFKIGAGGTVVVLLAGAWFLVYKPITALSEAKADLERQTTSLKNKSKPGKKSRSSDMEAEEEPFYLPTAELVERLEVQQNVDKKDLETAKQFYDEKAKRFAEFFDNLPNWTQGLAAFTSRFNDEIGRLQTEYRARFNVAEEALQVGVNAAAFETEIPLSMREFWMTSEVFRVLTKNEVGGLQTITYPDSRNPVETAKKHHDAMPIQVQALIPFSKIENVVADLLSSDRVPFVLENLEAVKSSELVEPYVQFVRQESYPNRAMAEDPSKKIDVLFPEPGVLVTLKLRGIYWKGIPVETVADES